MVKQDIKRRETLKTTLSYTLFVILVIFWTYRRHYVALATLNWAVLVFYVFKSYLKKQSFKNNKTFKEIPLCFDLKGPGCVSLTPIKDEVVFIFDVDDTLYDFKGLLRKKYIEYLRKYTSAITNKTLEESEKLCLEYYKEFGLTSTGLFKNHNVCPFDYFETVEKKTWEHLQEKVNHDLVKILQSIPFKKWCLSNSIHSIVGETLKKIGLYEIFDGYFGRSIYTADLFYKPDPRVYKFVEKILGVKRPSQIYFFDDNVEFIEGAKNAGWNVFLVKHDTLVNTVEELLKTLL